MNYNQNRLPQQVFSALSVSDSTIRAWRGEDTIAGEALLLD